MKVIIKTLEKMPKHTRGKPGAGMFMPIFSTIFPQKRTARDRCNAEDGGEGVPRAGLHRVVEDLRSVPRDQQVLQVSSLDAPSFFWVPGTGTPKVPQKR